MSILISVSNFRGCARAQIECDPIALVSGRNAAAALLQDLRRNRAA